MRFDNKSRTSSNFALGFDFDMAKTLLDTAKKFYDLSQDIAFYNDNVNVINNPSSSEMRIDERIRKTKDKYRQAIRIVSLLVDDECRKSNVDSTIFQYTPPVPDAYQRRDLYTVTNIEIWKLKDELSILTSKIPLYVLLENGIDYAKDKCIDTIIKTIKMKSGVV